MTEKKYDLIVIGSGPGGYVAAIKAAQLGMKVACVEKYSSLGGTCLNVGCMPSKALLHSSHKFEEVQDHLGIHGITVKDVSINLQKMLAHKDKIVDDLSKGIQFLFKKNQIDSIQGTATFSSENTITVDGNQTYQAKNFLIATGSKPAPLPGVEVDEKTIVSSTGALSLAKVPKHLIVIGGGYIGLELGSVWRRLGAQVTVVEYADRIVPAMDQEISSLFMKELQKQGMTFKLSTKVTGVKKEKKGITLSLEPASSQHQQDIEPLEGDIILVCTGRQPYTKNLGLDVAGIDVDEQGRIPVNQSFQTKVPHIFAIGDVIAGPMLAHKAEEEGSAVAEILNGQHPHINYGAIPAVVYTYPEVASVGKTEEELKAESRDYKIGKFPFSANSRARANHETTGLVKILADKKTDEVLGVHILHAEAGTMIAEAALAMEYKASAEDIARTCHAHPTVSEALKEAALAAYAKAIHI